MKDVLNTKYIETNYIICYVLLNDAITSGPFY